MMVPAPRTPGTGNTGSAFVPDTFSSLASSVRCLVFIGFDMVFFGISAFFHVCLDRVADVFFFACLILAKPENRQRLPLLAGIKRFRFRRAVLPGEVIEMEAHVVRLGSRMGVLEGVARVDGKTVAEGTMTCALGPASA